MSINLITADAVAWARAEAERAGGLRAHALLCDAPYHIESILRRFGKAGSAPARPARDGAFTRLSSGFIGEDWDSGSVSYRPSTWAAFAGVMLPGAYGAVMMGARGWHRLAAAIEGAAGVSVADLGSWADALAAAREARDWSLVESVEREIRGRDALADGMQSAGLILQPALFGWVYGTGQVHATPVRGSAAEREAWAGHKYGGALRPALEPIILFTKPDTGRRLSDILTTGAGALNIAGAQAAGGAGRYPGNFVIGCAPDCREGAHVAGCPCSELDAARPGAAGWFPHVGKALAEASPVRLQAKPSTAERDAGLPRPAAGERKANDHPTVKPLGLAQWLAALLLPPAVVPGRALFVPFAGSGSEVIAAARAGWDEITGVEIKARYAETARKRIAHHCNQARI